MKPLAPNALKSPDDLEAWIADADVMSLFGLIGATQKAAMTIIEPCMIALQERLAAAGNTNGAVQCGKTLKAMLSLAATIADDA